MVFKGRPDGFFGYAVDWKKLEEPFRRFRKGCKKNDIAPTSLTDRRLVVFGHDFFINGNGIFVAIQDGLDIGLDRSFKTRCVGINNFDSPGF